MKFIVITWLLLFSSLTFSQSTREDLPIHLRNSAVENNCDDYEGFYSKTETTRPPFVFGVFRDGSFSAAYICNWKKNKTPKIVIWQRNDEWVKSRPFSCSRVIEFENISPGGIEVEYREIDFSKLYHLKVELWEKGPKAKVKTWALITEEAGVGSILACHKGKWYYNNYD